MPPSDGRGSSERRKRRLGASFSVFSLCGIMLRANFNGIGMERKNVIESLYRYFRLWMIVSENEGDLLVRICRFVLSIDRNYSS